LEFSVYDFEAASPQTCRTLFEVYEAEATRLLDAYNGWNTERQGSVKELDGAIFEGNALNRDRFPLRKIYDLTLKCSHLFNILDARGAISVTERVALIGRVRKLACEVARIYLHRETVHQEATTT
jgi:glycyl-tRNA synthetase alpha chain